MRKYGEAVLAKDILGENSQVMGVYKIVPLYLRRTVLGPSVLESDLQQVLYLQNCQNDGQFGNFFQFTE